MWRNLFLSFLSGLILILSFPNFNLGIFSWFGFVPLFLAIENKRPFLRFLLSYLTGAIFFFGTLYWLYHVSILGLILLVLYLAIYFGLFGLFSSYITHYTLHITQLFFIPSLWVLLEYLRSNLFTGFGWVLLGYSQYLNLPLIQISEITGSWGVSFLVMMVNVCIWQLISDLRYQKLVVRGKLLYFLTPLFCFIFTYGFGFLRLNQTSNFKLQTSFKISIIQGNIPQEIKWERQTEDFILERYLDLTLKAKRDSPDLIIWPETSLPYTLIYPEKKEINFLKKIETPLLLGAVVREKESYFNSAILLTSDREIQRYDKIHLVPFGEYIPLKKIFGFLETIYPIGDFTFGNDYTIFSLTPKHPKTLKPKFSVLICFEDIFPQVSREFVKRGGDFLVVITNDAWFGRTSAPYQHLQASIFRAIENRRFLVRSANTGISCFISPSGEIISKVEEKKKDIFIPGYKTQEIFLSRRDLSFYTRFGDYFVLLCLIVFVCGIILKIPNHSSSTEGFGSTQNG